MIRQFGYGPALLAMGLMLGPSAFAVGRPGNRPGPPPHAFPGQRGAVRNQPQSYIGIDVKDISDDQVPSLKLRDSRGAEITQVDHDGPAGKMGLHEHDVVLQMNGTIIEGEEQIRRMLKDTAPGRTVILLVSRDGQQLTFSTQMADKLQLERQAWDQHLAQHPAQYSANPQAPASGPSGSDPNNSTTYTSPNNSASSTLATGPAASSRYSKSFLGTLLTSPTYTGAQLERMGPQMAQFFGVPGGSGLLVRKIETNSPAAMAGLHVGDYVVRVNQRAISSLGDWTKAIREAKGRPVAVLFLRDRQEKTLTLTPDTKKRSDLELPGQPEVAFRFARLTDL